jgi:hypothetical protein
VIVVGEFAALVSGVPEFVDGVVDVAQRGRSLGLHLILATQRPARVIKDNLRANTNLRVALRMADEHDSVDVLGSPVAARTADRTRPTPRVQRHETASGRRHQNGIGYPRHLIFGAHTARARPTPGPLAMHWRRETERWRAFTWRVSWR